MAHRVLSVGLVGVAPLLMHSSRLVDPLDPTKRRIDRLARRRAKTDADHEELARLEWYGGLWLVAGRPCVPAEAVEACLSEAARARRAGKRIKAGLMVPVTPTIRHDGPETLDALQADGRFTLRVPVQVNGKRLMRTRPRFDVWSIDLAIHYLPGLLDPAEILDHLRVAGDTVGLGDWRPRFGRFRVEIPA